MFRCLKCGRKFTVDELAHSISYRGEFQGRAAYEREPCCPLCGFEVEYAVTPEPLPLDIFDEINEIFNRQLSVARQSKSAARGDYK